MRLVILPKLVIRLLWGEPFYHFSYVLPYIYYRKCNNFTQKSLQRGYYDEEANYNWNNGRFSDTCRTYSGLYIQYVQHDKSKPLQCKQIGSFSGHHLSNSGYRHRHGASYPNTDAAAANSHKNRRRQICEHSNESRSRHHSWPAIYLRI